MSGMAGITIIPDYGHFIIQKDNISMTCDSGELLTAIPEFLEYYSEKVMQTGGYYCEKAFLKSTLKEMHTL